MQGIEVVSIAAGYNDPYVGTGMSAWRRMLKFYCFAKSAARVGKNLSAPDVVFATHTPLPVGLAGISLSRHFDVPFVFEVRDLWPEALIDLGLLKSAPAIWWLARMARKVYARAAHIVALSPGMKEGIVHAGVPAGRVTVIPNGSDLDLFRPDLNGSFWRDSLGLGQRFAAIYFGAMGKANGLEYVIESARILRARGKNHIVLVLVGDGGQRTRLQRMADDYGLSSNVIFAGPVCKVEVARIVAACQACMITIQPSKNNTWSPNKMFDALAAGKPVLINVPGWLGETIQNNKCGICLDPYRPEALADALEELASKPELCRGMGRNARVLAEREFDRKELAETLERVLLGTVKKC